MEWPVAKVTWRQHNVSVLIDFEATMHLSAHIMRFFIIAPPSTKPCDLHHEMHFSPLNILEICMCHRKSLALCGIENEASATGVSLADGPPNRDE